MFTGIIEELGKVKRVTHSGRLMILDILAQKTLPDAKIGDSISLNGVCLTLTSISNNSFSFEVMAETFKKTNLGLLNTGEQVNLERSLKLGDRLSGHFVSGHVDCLGLIRNRVIRNGNLTFEIAIPENFIPFCLPKGSIALDGISLTLAGRRANIISVCIIPHTFKNTTLSFKGPSDKLNVEFDILAKKAAI
ncbi:MAG: riboflavin synthase [Candidatus Omnitrophica bacterium]|jgi:riboflavin synthase|nr:riboflavin synthase [Candidatus Omnitrophota bacterium]